MIAPNPNDGGPFSAAQPLRLLRTVKKLGRPPAASDIGNGFFLRSPTLMLSPAFYNKDLTLLVSFIGMPRRQKKLPCDSRIGTCSAQVWRLHSSTPVLQRKPTAAWRMGWGQWPYRPCLVSHSRHWRSPSPALAAPSGPAQPFWNKRWVAARLDLPAKGRPRGRRRRGGSANKTNHWSATFTTECMAPGPGQEAHPQRAQRSQTPQSGEFALLGLSELEKKLSEFDDV